MRRLIFCFDGSWNKLSNPEPTNVVLIAESTAPVDDKGVQQIVYYDEGVGTGKGDYIRGGAFGTGLKTNIREAYRFLIFNYLPGDEIFVFGFSRGAFTAVSFVGFLRTAGVISVNDAVQIDQALDLYQQHSTEIDDDPVVVKTFRARYSPHVLIDHADKLWREEHGFPVTGVAFLEIKYLGVWDIVASLGLPVFVGGVAKWFNKRYKFYDVRLSKTVNRARHAVSIDEARAHFAPTLWTNLEELNAERGVAATSDDAPYQQHWFPGDHGSVGGGGPERGLSSNSLNWVLAGAVESGLKVLLGERSRIVNLAGDFAAPLLNTPIASGLARLWYTIKMAYTRSPRPGPSDPAWISPAAKRRWLANPQSLHERVPYRPAPLLVHTDAIAASAAKFIAEQSITVIAIHEIKKGETLGSIAKGYYGDAKLYNIIFAANLDTLDDPDQITVGRPIRIPPKPAEPLNPD